jgi:hypothetical protein
MTKIKDLHDAAKVAPPPKALLHTQDEHQSKKTEQRKSRGTTAAFPRMDAG